MAELTGTKAPVRRPRLAHGYFGRTLDRMLDQRPAVAAADVLDVISPAWRKPEQRVSLSALVRTNPARYRAPFRGVICRRGTLVTWQDVVMAANPKAGAILERLSTIQANRVDLLLEEFLTRPRPPMVIDTDVLWHLRWLVKYDFAFKQGRDSWGATAKGKGICQSPPTRQPPVDIFS